jgi:hypothetical protein
MDGERGMPSWARNGSSNHRFHPTKSTASMYSFLMIVLSNFRIWVHYQIAQNVFQCLGFLDDCFKLGCLILWLSSCLIANLTYPYFYIMSCFRRL